jgi:hypothetical protein
MVGNYLRPGDCWVCGKSHEASANSNRESDFDSGGSNSGLDSANSIDWMRLGLRANAAGLGV